MDDPDPGPSPSSVSLKSERSMGHRISFTEEQPTEQNVCKRKTENSNTGLGLKSESMESIGAPMNFTTEQAAVDSLKMDQCDSVSMKSDKSMSNAIVFSDEHRASLTEEQRSGQLPDTPLWTVFKELEENIMSFVREELNKFYKALDAPQPPQSEEERSREAFLEITLDFLRKMNQDDLAKDLKSSFYCGVSHSQLRSMLKMRYQKVSEGIPKAGNAMPLNEIYTELYITEGGTAGVINEHEIRQIEITSRKSVTPETTIPCEDIFKGSVKREGITQTSEDRQTQVRTVLTMGVAGIGKTVLTQKFCLDWAEGRANQDIQLLFPFTFRELNVLRDRQFSLVELVQHFFSKSIQLCSSKVLHVVFIFDGLDENRLPLNFTETVTDPTEPSSVGELLVNLIKGSLLPCARVWITTRPAAANQIPAECMSMVTEVRGFADPQKEQYFTKRFRDEHQATAVISHIKKSRSLYTMCRIPVFCWITSTVLEHVMKNEDTDQLPSTLTEMYVFFLVVQIKLKNLKYDKSEPDRVWSSENRSMVLALGKLAFKQLREGNLIFYESDIEKCGLDADEASMYSGVFTLVFKEESGLYQEKVYCFVHLSVQEFLAALYVHTTFINSGKNLLSNDFSLMDWFKTHQDLKLIFHQTAVNKALWSSKGHWDLFLRFLLGLSQETNEKHLLGLLDWTSSYRGHCDEITDYIEKKLNARLSVERSITLFHCLNELGDNSLVKRVQQYMRDGKLSRHTSPELWSAVVFILLSSDNDLSVFDLKKYSASEEALRRLLPVVKESNAANLSYCNLSFESCNFLSSVLSSPSSSLRLLDLSNNDLYDNGVEQLCQGLISPECRLETLRLSGCLVSEEGGTELVSALSSTSSCLKELDLSYNHPAASIEKLTALREDPRYSLNICKVEPAGEQWLTPGLTKYLVELSLDPNSAHSQLELKDDNRTVTMTDSAQPYSDHPDRFDSCRQVLSSTELTGRRYWEVDWNERGNNWEVDVAVSYRGIGRKGGTGESGFGVSGQSWCLRISSGGYSVLHEGRQTPVSSDYNYTDRVAVYLDYEGGSLTFYKIKNKELSTLHTFTTEFTEPLYAGFGFGLWSSKVLVSFKILSGSLIYLDRSIFDR